MSATATPTPPRDRVAPCSATRSLAPETVAHHPLPAAAHRLPRPLPAALRRLLHAATARPHDRAQLRSRGGQDRLHRRPRPPPRRPHNAILQPLLGDRSVLLLDGREHLRQRLLLLPPFHGERMQAYAETMREVAERQVASWPRGHPFPAQPSMQAITLEVILRTVFGLEDEEGVEQVGAPLRRVLDATASQARLFALQATSSKNPHRQPWGRFNALVAEADRVLYEEIPARRAQADGDRDGPLPAAGRPRRGGPAAHRRRAARRADDPALRRSRDDRDGAELDPGAPRSPPGRARAACAEHRTGETAFLDATIKESLRLRPVVPAVGRYLAAPLEVGGHCFPPTSTSASRFTSCTGGRTCIRTPTPSAPSASSSGRPEPISGFPSGAACAAASAPASPCSRCGSSCRRSSIGCGCCPRAVAVSASAVVPSPSCLARAPASPSRRRREQHPLGAPIALAPAF